VITPRRTRLHRASNLRAFQRAIRTLTDHASLPALRDSAVIVPSRAAADELRRTLENRAFGTRQTQDAALALPQIVTRDGWYDLMHSRLPAISRRASELEREVILGAAAREIERDKRPPFRMRAGLIVAMLAFYDDLRRTNVPVERFETAMLEDLTRDVSTDRGAARLADQTTFLAATFRRYQDRLAAVDLIDEHGLRARLLDTPADRPVRQVIVTVGDRDSDPAGLWKADFDLLSRLPRLERVDMVATRSALAAGLLDRLLELLPGFEEAPPIEDEEQGFTGPIVIGAHDKPFALSRDREEELTAVAKGIKASSSRSEAALDRRAVIFKRPLPYVYLAHSVFDDAGIPWQAFDALPLAAESYAAALDLVFEFVTSGFTREPVIALLSSPHFDFDVDGVSVSRADVAGLNRMMCERGFFGGVDYLRAYGSAGEGGPARAAKVAAAAADELRSLTTVGPPSTQLADLLAFLTRHDRKLVADDPIGERHLRARSAIRGALTNLTQAHGHFDDSPVSFAETAAMIRRWIEGQTFTPRTGTTGVQLVDAQAARYGEFDEIFLVGLVEREWPEPVERNIFYPSSLLARFGWPESRAMLGAERAAFRDLARLASRSVTFSTFELENDSIIGPSVLLEEIDRLGLELAVVDRATARMLTSEAIASDPVVASAVADPQPREWLSMRQARSDRSSPKFHGTALPRRLPTYSVSAVERYLRCPFIYFCERVLALEEDPQDQSTLSPKDLGIFVHSVFQAFFHRWNSLGRGSITPADLPEARRIFREVIEPLLATLPEAEAIVQRTRLLGSAVDPGLAEAVFQVEAEWATPVVERLLEYPLEGEFELQSEHGSRRLRLRGKADRIDLLADGTLRVIDYKLGYAPDRRLALQLPIYGVCAVQHLRAISGKDWTLGQAGYIAFGEDRSFVPMIARTKNRDEVLLAAQSRLVSTIDAIERGHFPPTPYDTSQCMRCAYTAVCRKDYVGEV